MDRETRLWLTLYVTSFLLLGGMAVALYFGSSAAFFGLAAAWIVVFAASVLARRRLKKSQTKPQRLPSSGEVTQPISLVSPGFGPQMVRVLTLREA